MADEVEPLADDELLYRRVPAATGWFEPATGMRVGDLRKAKFTVKPQPDVPGGYDISHAELPDQRFGHRPGMTPETFFEQED